MIFDSVTFTGTFCTTTARGNGRRLRDEADGVARAFTSTNRIVLVILSIMPVAVRCTPAVVVTKITLFALPMLHLYTMDGLSMVIGCAFRDPHINAGKQHYKWNYHVHVLGADCLLREEYEILNGCNINIIL